MKRKAANFLKCAFVLSLLTTSIRMPLVVSAEQTAISGMTATGLSTAGHGAELVVDGNKATFWQTPTPYQSINSYKRNIDLDLHGLYDVTGITLFTKTDAYYQYSIYASEDGVAFNKVAYKSDDIMGKAEGESFALANTKARFIRVNINFKSGQARQVDLNEIEVYGSKISDEAVPKQEIKTDKFEETAWGKEYKKVESNQDYAKSKTITETSDLVGRILGDKYKDLFTFEIRNETSDGNDVFVIENGAAGKIKISGNDGVSLASGFNYYIRYYCNVDYNPMFSSNLNMPDKLPRVEGRVTKETQYDLRYALNFCTYSYTMAFWNWDEYEKFIDWAAMSGVNLMLDIVGQEEVQRRTLREFNYTDAEIKDYVTGPGYFAWFYMQNMVGYGGPLPDNWFEGRVELGRKIHDRMQSYGIKPVLEGFAGMVPVDFATKNPKAKVIPAGGWSGYTRPATIQTFLLDKDVTAGKEDYFQKFAETFYQKQREIYGEITPYFAVDPFHEGGDRGEIGGQDTKIYKTIQDTMIAQNKNVNATWIMQLWGSNANPTQLKDLNKDNIVVLDLYSESEPHNNQLESSETPWIWNFLHNFGGRMGMDGQMEVLSTQIPKDKASKSHMIGIGITPESINNSPVMYELMFDMAWTKDPIDYREWVGKYIERRYGKTNADVEAAWDILLDTVYSMKKTKPGQGVAESAVNWLPSMGDFNSASTYGHSITAYDTKEFEKAIGFMAKAYPEFKDSATFKFDFVDMTAQVLSNSAKKYQKAMATAYANKDLTEFDRISKQFLDMIKLEEKVLSTNKEFMVGTWVNKSRKMLSDADDWTKDLFEFNARSLITVWGSSSNDSLLDYSNRQLSGLTQDYYLQRWESGINEFRNRIISGNVSNKGVGNRNDYWLMGWKWANQKSDEGHVYSEEPSGLDLGVLAQEVSDKHSLASLDKFLEDANAEEVKVNVALHKTVTTTKTTDTAHPLTNLTDGNSESTWMQGNATWPSDLTVDLAGRFNVTGVSFKLPQVADDFPIGFTVEVFDNNAWKQIAQQDIKVLNGTVDIDCFAVASKVRYTFTSSKEAAPQFAELMVYGTPYVGDAEPTLTNVARGKLISVTPNESPNNLGNATDGNTGTLASFSNGFAPGTANVAMELDLKGTFDVTNINVVMEKTNGWGFVFQTVVQLEDDSWEVVDDQSGNTFAGASKNVFNKEVGKKIKKVKIVYLGKTDKSKFWPGIMEIEVWANVIPPVVEEQAQRQNIALHAGAIATKGQENASKLTDGDTNSLWTTGGDTYPETVKIDLGAESFVETARVNFEANASSPSGRAFKFIVKAYNGNDELVQTDDQTATTVKIPYYDVEINKNIRYIEVTLTGKAPGESAWTAIAEIQAFAPLSNVLKNATLSTTPTINAAAIHDENNETGISVDGTKNVYEFTLDKAKDLYVAEVIKGSSDALRYKIETKENKDDPYTVFIDKSKNTNRKNKTVVEAKTSKLAKYVKVTVLNETYTLNEIRIYEYKALVGVLTYISEIEGKVNKLTIGDAAGNFSTAAYEKLKAELNDVRAKIAKLGELNSKESLQFMNQLSAAYLTFNKTGFVTVDRSALLSAIIHAEDLQKFAADEGKESLIDAEFIATLAASRAVYNKSSVTQAELDTEKTALEEKITVIEDKLDVISQYKLAMTRAEGKINDASIGDVEGQVTQASVDALAAVIAKAKDSYPDSDKDQIMVLTNNLLAAIVKFDESIIVVNKDELRALIATIEVYQESASTKDSWKVLQEKVASAKHVLDNRVTQVEATKALKELKAADAGRVNLNRKDLENALERSNNLKEADYTVESWKAFSLVKEASSKVASEVSLNQKDVDDATDALVQAQNKLIKQDSDTSLLKSILKNAIDKAMRAEASEAFKTLAPGVKGLIIAMRNAAQLAYDDAQATNEECLNAWMDLATALQYLDFKADKAALLALIEECKAINTDDYVDGVEEFKAALHNANAVSVDVNALQIRIDDAYKRLEKAKDGLVKGTSVNKLPLQIMINALEAKVGDGSKYQQNAAYNAFVKALNDAKAIIAKEDATQVEVNNAMSVLADAYENIRLRPTEEQLEQLNGYLKVVNKMNRALYTNEQLVSIDAVTTKVNAMIANFDERTIDALLEEINTVLDIIHNTNSKEPASPVITETQIKPGNTSHSAQPNTGDTTNIAGIMLMLLLSGCGIAINKRKRNQKA